MKFREIFRFEVDYQLRRGSTWLYFAVLLTVTFVLLRLSRPTDDTFANAPAHIAFFTVVGNVVWLLMAASIAGDAAARDVQTRMDALFYTTPISKFSYLGGRFLAAFALNAFLQFAVPAGILLAFYIPGIEAELLGPFRPAAYLSAFGFIALPTAFVATAFQFSLAAFHRRGVASYLGSMLLLVVSVFVSTTAANLFGDRKLAKLLDAVGLVGILSEFEKWTPIEKNTRLIELDGTFLWNRLLWFGLGLGALGFIYFHFRFGHHTVNPPWWNRWTRRWLVGRAKASGRKADLPTAANTPINIPQVRRTFGTATHLHQLLTIAGVSFRTTALCQGGLALITAVALPTVLFATEHMQHMDVPLLPQTQEVLTFLAPSLGNVQTPWVIIPLLLVFYAGQLIWREREAGLGDIAGATPAPEWALLLGLFLGLGLLIVAWLGILMATGVLIQAVLGYHDFEAGLYLRALFGLQLPNYLLFALLALVGHVLVNQKYVGHLVLLLAYGFVAFAPKIGVEHHLLVFGTDPGWSYSDMRGFGPFLGPWLWFKGYWAAWAMLLAVAAKLLWVRGREQRFGARLHQACRRFTRPTAWVAAAALGLLLTLGGFIFYNTNVLNTYDTVATRMQRHAEYERRYAQYQHTAQPRQTATRLHVEIYPRRREVDIRGTYQLVNRNAVAINSIHVATASVHLNPASAVETGTITFDRPATPVLADEEHGHRIYTLKQPLQPGDSLQLRFEVHFKPRGFRNSGLDASVAANGTYFTNREWLPAIGYQPTRELSSAGDRRRYRLTPRPLRPSVNDLRARQDMSGAEQVAFEAVVGTDEGQTAGAQGTLRRTWTEGGRRYFHYATTAPVLNDHAFFSAHYAVREAQWKASASNGQMVAIQVFHHPAHTVNLDRMVRSVQASLNYYTQQFGPYPFSNIRLVERPGHGRGMHADASTIDYEEGFALLYPAAEGLDLPFYVVAHEVAHQWWGAARLLAAPVEGAGLLVESLATFSAMQLVEEASGGEQLGRYLSEVRKTYEVPRTRAAPPLLQASGAFPSYRKGPFALYALSKYIGKEQVNGALRRLLEKHGSGTPPLPTSLDLYRELQGATPDSLHYLLHDLFETNTFWELRTEQATARQTKAGTWQVTLDVQAHKEAVNSAGVETPLPMNDWVEVGVFAPVHKSGEPGQLLYLRKHLIRSGQQTIKVTVPHKPDRAGIDPNHLLIDIMMEDNDKKVKIGD